MTAKTLETQAREAAEKLADKFAAINAWGGSPTGRFNFIEAYCSGYVEAATAREKEIEFAATKVRVALELASDRWREIEELRGLRDQILEALTGAHEALIQHELRPWGEFPLCGQSFPKTMDLLETAITKAKENWK